MLPGDSVRSHRLRAQSHKTAPPPTSVPVASSRSPGYPQFLSDVAMNQRFHDLFLGLDHLLEQLTEARVTLTYVYCLLKDLVKNTDGQPHEKINNQRSGRFLSSSVPGAISRHIAY